MRLKCNTYGGVSWCSGFLVIRGLSFPREPDWTTYNNKQIRGKNVDFGCLPRHSSFPLSHLQESFCTEWLAGSVCLLGTLLSRFHGYHFPVINSYLMADSMVLWFVPKASCSQYLRQFWISVMVSVCWKKKLLRWVANYLKQVLFSQNHLRLLKIKCLRLMNYRTPSPSVWAHHELLPDQRQENCSG